MNLKNLEIIQGLNVRNEPGFRYADQLVDGIKTVETRENLRLKGLIGKTVKIIRTGEGAAQVIGEVTFKNQPPIVYDSPAKFKADRHRHLVGNDSDYKFDGLKYGYEVTNPVRYKYAYLAPKNKGILTTKKVPGPRFESKTKEGQIQ
jgi:predicted transcriptional regulator